MNPLNTVFTLIRSVTAFTTLVTGLWLVATWFEAIREGELQLDEDT